MGSVTSHTSGHTDKVTSDDDDRDDDDDDDDFDEADNTNGRCP
jgi:hypothetical protein